MSKSLDLFFALGRPFGPIYSLTMKLREKLYIRGVLGRKSLGVPVISVGNLVLGGSGKSPAVAHIARLLIDHGHRPAIISRGYRGKARNRVNIVSDGNSILLTPDLAGDEPYMLAEALPTVPVLTGVRRFFPGSMAVERFNADVIILDDGFQHLAMDRDIDLVLFDGTALAGNSRVFPGGPLREPVSSLNRCHAFLITGVTADNRQRTEYFTELLRQRFGDKPVYISTVLDLQLMQGNGKVATVDKASPCFAFCGIANPTRFRNSLAQLGVFLANFQFYKDHVAYDQTSLTDICDRAKGCGAKYLVTTEKDFVKIKHLHCDLPLFRLQVVNLVDRSFDEYLLNSLKQIR